jgi:hypothetical protein
MPAASKVARPGSPAGEGAGAGNRQVLQEQLGPLLGVVLGQPVASPHTYRVGTGTRGTAMPNGMAARYQANAAAASASGPAKARA